MKPEFHQRFVLLDDSLATLEQALITVLTRQRYVQSDYPDTDNYLEGTVLFWKDETNSHGGDRVVVWLNNCAMATHIVHVAYREVFSVSLGPEVIAQNVSRAFRQKVHLQQGVQT